MEKSKMKYVRPKTIVIKVDVEGMMCGIGLKDSNNRDPDKVGYGSLSKRGFYEDTFDLSEEQDSPWSDE